jgi:hypothetical protein
MLNAQVDHRIDLLDYPYAVRSGYRGEGVVEIYRRTARQIAEHPKLQKGFFRVYPGPFLPMIGVGFRPVDIGVETNLGKKIDQFPALLVCIGPVVESLHYTPESIFHPLDP